MLKWVQCVRRRPELTVVWFGRKWHEYGEVSVSPAHDLSIPVLIPSLVIAGISVPRRILTIGAGLSVQETEGRSFDLIKFNQSMTELLVSGAIIVLVAFSLWLINRRVATR